MNTPYINSFLGFIQHLISSYILFQFQYASSSKNTNSFFYNSLFWPIVGKRCACWYIPMLIFHTARIYYKHTF